MIIPTDAEKSFGKIQHLFMMGNAWQTAMEGEHNKGQKWKNNSEYHTRGESFSSKIRRPLMPTFTSSSHHSTESSRPIN